MIAATLEKYHEQVHIPPESTLRDELVNRPNFITSKFILPRGDDPSEWSQVLGSLVERAGLDKIDTYSRTLHYAKDIAMVSAKAISAGTSGGINERRCMTYLFARLADYRQKWPDSHAYDADLSFSEWRARLLVHVNKIDPKGRRSKNIRHIAAVGTMALAWVWALNNKVGWIATPISVDPRYLPLKLKLDRAYAELAKVEPRTESPTQLCKLCFLPATYAVSSLDRIGFHSSIFNFYCTQHFIDVSLSDGPWFEPIETIAKLRERVISSNRANAARRASNAALVAGDQKALDNVASAIETAIKGETVVKQAPLHPGYRWLRPYRENTTDIACIVDYCNAAALVRVVNRKPGIEHTTKYVCPQHLAQGIMLGAEATVTTL